jgi:hypothetical protein
VDLKSDPKREKYPETGLPIRAMRMSAKVPYWDAVDLNHLDRASVLEWMRGRSDRYLKAIVCALLHHEAPTDLEEAPPAPAPPPPAPAQAPALTAPAEPVKCICTATGHDPEKNPHPDCALHSIGPAGQAYRARMQQGKG